MSKLFLPILCLLMTVACQQSNVPVDIANHSRTWTTPANAAVAKRRAQQQALKKARAEAERQARAAKDKLEQRQLNSVAKPVQHVANIPKPSAIALPKTGTQPRVVRNKVQIGKPYTIKGKRYAPKMHHHYNENGLASWYGGKFQGRLTANGEVFDKWGMTAAHKTLQLPAYVQVTNKENGKQITLRVNDRGPFKPNRIIDLSRAAAEKLDMLKSGVAKVNVKLLTGKAARIAAANWESFQVAERIPFPPAPVNRALVQQAAVDGVATEVQVALSTVE